MLTKPKPKEKIKYTRIDDMLKLNAQYNILLGERSNGKSYAVKEHLVKKAYLQDKKFMYLRRYDLDTKTLAVNNYCSDVPVFKITGGEFDSLTYFRGQFFLGNNNEDGTVSRERLVGYAAALAQSEHLKSQAFPEELEDIVYEEFVTDSLYLDKEPEKLLNVVSTIFRHREGQVWLIGNTISQICPYFNEWQLVGIPNQKSGTIDEYRPVSYDADGNKIETLILVKNCESAGSKSKMFFGKPAEAIKNGSWRSEEHAHLPRDYKEYTVIYELKLCDWGFNFIMQLLVSKEGGIFIFVYPFKEKSLTRKIRRKITSTFSDDPFITMGLNPKIRAEVMMKECLKQGNICYSDNLTGSNFEQLLRNRKGVL